MPTTTQLPTYSSITQSSSFNAPITLRATITSLHNYNNSREDAVDHILAKLAASLTPYVDYRQDYDAERMQYITYGSVQVVPLGISAVISNELYALDNLRFSEAEIAHALRHTYPERFI